MNEELIKRIIDVLRYVEEETVMNDNGDWTLGYLYDPNHVSSLLGELERRREE